MKFLQHSALTLALLAASTGSAQATFYYYFGSDIPTDAGNANTTTSVATAQAEWISHATSLPSLGGTVSTFETNFANVSTATGINANGATPNFSSTSQNVNLSNPGDVFVGTSDGATYTSAAQNEIFPIDPADYGKATFGALGSEGTPSFTIEATETIDITGDNISGQRRSGVFYSDDTTKGAATAAAWQDVLSIGKFNGFTDATNVTAHDPINTPHTEFDNDDFNLEITGGDSLYAFAFKIINNNVYSGVDEFLKIFSTDGGTELAQIGGAANTATLGNNISDGSSAIPGYSGGNGTISGVDFVHTSFVGVVTDDPTEIFNFLQFNEDGSANDIGIFDLQFATVTAVPVPAAVWLFGSGLLALFGLGRKGRKA